MQRNIASPVEQQAAADFEAAFGVPPSLVVKAPGRVNLMGDHTDYNDGFVLPMAIQQSTVIAARPRSDRKLHAGAILLNRWTTVDLDQPVADASESWVNYIIGVVRELAARNYPLNGADLIVTGSTPVGAGLSSSASLEMAALLLFETMGGFQLSDEDAARLCQRVENDFVGVNSGIMDQYVIRTGREGHALFLDCQDLSREYVPVCFEQAAFVITNTGIKRGLADSQYNQRVSECQEAVAAMSKALGRADAHRLRAFTPQELEASKSSMPPLIYRRARHVITENARTQAACSATRTGDAITMGMLMNASHGSLATDYEVTGPQLDAMAQIARTQNGCFGSRMTGAGFGGCVISLVDAAMVATFCQVLLDRYAAETGSIGEALIATPSAGASVASKT